MRKFIVYSPRISIFTVSAAVIPLSLMVTMYMWFFTRASPSETLDAVVVSTSAGLSFPEALALPTRSIISVPTSHVTV